MAGGVEVTITELSMGGQREEKCKGANSQECLYLIKACGDGDGTRTAGRLEKHGEGHGKVSLSGSEHH